MLFNFLKVSLRNMWRNRAYAAINIIGLTVGLTACFIIGVYVIHETSYDRFHEKSERIYRIHSDTRGFGLSNASSPALFSELHKYNAIASATRVFRHWFDPLVSRDKENGFIESQFFFADSSVFDVFSLTLLAGEGREALGRPMTVLLTASTARKYFGKQSPVGSILKYNAEHEFTVAGVIDDFPSTSHVRPDFIASMGSTEKLFWPTFLKSSGNLVKTYIVVRPEASVENLAADLTSIYTTRYGKDNRVTLSLMPLTDIHLKSTVEKDFSVNNDIRYVQLLGVIGLIIILISLINYTNLTAARSLSRSKEVGIRQTLGGFRSMIVIQFLCESFLFVLLGLAFSMVLSEMLFPAINRMTSIHLSFSLLDSTHWMMITASVVLLAITGGVYPAWIVARFKIVHTLKGRVEHVRGRWLRKGLVISQFVSGVILIVATSVIWHQMQFIREARLGFTKEEVAIVRLMDPSVASNLPALKQRWLNIPGVQSVTLANAMPGKTHAGDYISHHGTDEDLAVAVNWIDEGFVPTMDLSIIAGRNISPAHPTDNDGSVLINEATARELGYPDPEKAIGTLITLQGTDGGKQRTVVGVVNDFHYESFRHKITPLILVPQFKRCAYLMVRCNTQALDQTLDRIKTVWSEMATEQPFAFTFLDDSFQQLYAQDRRWSLVVGAGASAALIIACLGLFGLVIFSVQRRVKEIGVRKILGATIGNIIRLLTKEYLLMIGAANMIAWPIAYYWMQEWLTQFVYRPSFPWLAFPLALVATMSMAMLTIGFQAFKAAVTNPTKALASE